tara:strand:+ start:1325 stop:2005 length:681 start_codon:yes stop_codon:yes gene_type:complete
MSDTESDSSIEPQEEEVVSKNVKIKRGKPTTIPKKRKKVITEIIEIESDDDLPNSEPETEPVYEKPKRERKYKTAGRPKLTEQQKLEKELSKKTLIKEKVIYMIPDDKGGYKKVKNPVLTERDLKKIKLEQEKEEQEKQIGKKLIQKKNGTIDKRSIGMKTRTPAQIAATERMLEANKKRREALKKLKKQETKETIKDSVREVVKEPFYEPKEPPKPKNPYEGLIF